MEWNKAWSNLNLPRRPRSLRRLVDAEPHADVLAEPQEGSFVLRVLGGDEWPYQADVYFGPEERTAHIAYLGPAEDRTLPRGTGWGTRKWGAWRDRWRESGFLKVLIATAACERRNAAWTGYAFWPKVGFDGLMTRQQKHRLPARFRGSRRISDLYALPGGPEAWKQFGGRLDNLEFTL